MRLLSGMNMNTIYDMPKKFDVLYYDMYCRDKNVYNDFSKGSVNFKEINTLPSFH